MAQNERNTISVADANMNTTSLVEAMNSVIQRSFPPNPHWYKFVESLKLHEAIKSTDLFQIASGQITNPKLQQIRAEDIQRKEKIGFLSNKLNLEEITAAEFLEQMCDSSVPTPIGA